MYMLFLSKPAERGSHGLIATLPHTDQGYKMKRKRKRRDKETEKMEEEERVNKKLVYFIR